VFSEVFLVQIRRKLRKIHSEVRLQGKKTSENAFRIGNPGEKELWEVGRENFVDKIFVLIKIEYYKKMK
jgi:hypothetical protein